MITHSEKVEQINKIRKHIYTISALTDNGVYDALIEITNLLDNILDDIDVLSPQYKGTN